MANTTMRTAGAAPTAHVPPSQAPSSGFNFKSVLQERLARRAEVVIYRIESEQGPPHDRSFVAVAEVSGEEIGRGEGKTKKSAEQEAALRALDRLEESA